MSWQCNNCARCACVSDRWIGAACAGRLIGSRCGPFDVAIDALASGLVEVAPLVSDTFDLSDGLRALERAAEPGVMKVLLDVSERRGVAQQPPPDLAGR